MALHGHPIVGMLVIFALTLATAEEDSLPTPAAAFYDVLNSNGLPIGLFPKSISHFSIDPASGRFQLHLPFLYPCDAKFETRVRYECDIKGIVKYGRIANLSGVAAQELFLWLPVRAIQVDIPSSGLIYFDVGVVSKQFSLSFFETPKDCLAIQTADVGGGNDVVFFDDDRVRIVENQSGKFGREHFMDQEQSCFVNAD